VANQGPQPQHGVVWGTPPNAHSVVVVGDLHGLAGALEDILDQTRFTGCTMVFVGDYIDRGPDGDKVLQAIYSLSTNPSAHGYGQVVALRGNHEDMVLRARRDPSWRAWWEANGGHRKDWDWLCDHKAWDWLEGLPLLYQHPQHILFQGGRRRLIVSHATINYQHSLEEQVEQDLLWKRHVSGYGHHSLCVHGHTVQPGGVPTLQNTSTGPVLMIDTGSSKPGIVTGVSFPEAICSPDGDHQPMVDIS